LDEDDQKLITILALYLKEGALPQEKRIPSGENLINTKERIILNFLEPSLKFNRPSSLSTSLGIQIERLIAYADLSKDEEEKFAAQLVEITKHRLERELGENNKIYV